METLNKMEFEMIKNYQKVKDENIPLYFFKKFRDDLIDITFSKINSKFTSTPYEKGDFVHIIWKAIKITLENYKSNQDFQSVLLKNCYFTTIKELRKFMNNGEMVMNVSKSLDKRIADNFKESANSITYISTPRNTLIKSLIDD
ncbi:MAG: hypothetical protein MJ219_03825, partial [Mycoplasmoidaceae bacterium]|nr:hypothetical protein [Mycoplasmoidaceae bacterium]